MSPVLIEAGIIIGVAIVVIRMAFLIGKKNNRICYFKCCFGLHIE